MVAQEEANDLCEYHADNELPLAAFVRLQTQWRVAAGMAGVIFLGLEYASFATVMDELRVPRVKRAALIADLRTMERAALPIMNERPDDG